MSWEREVIDEGVDLLVERNSPQLLAMLLTNACQTILDERQRHADELAAVRRGSEIGLQIAREASRMRRQGRKAARLDDLIPAAKQ